MAPRKPANARRTVRRPARKVQPRSGMRQVSAIIGAVLVGMAVLWFLWLYARQVNPGLSSFNFTLPAALAHNSSPVTTADPLVAAGITLSTPAQDPQPLIGHEQAIFLADQMQPGAAEKAGSVSAEYVLLSDTNSKTLSTTLHNTPAWVVHYTKVAEPQPDTAADPQAVTTQHDVYIFLDANTGQELLELWL